MKAIKRPMAAILTVLMLLATWPLAPIEANAASRYLWPVIHGTANKHVFKCSCSSHGGKHYGQDISGSKFGEAILCPVDGEVIEIKTGCRGKSNYGKGKSCSRPTCNPNDGFGSKSTWKGLKFCNGGSGNGVVVRDTKTGEVFSVAHMAYDPVVKLGPVKKGQVLGFVGETGCSAGVHLHLGLKTSKNGSFINPMKNKTYDKPKNTAFASTLIMDTVSYPKNKKSGDSFSVSGVVASGSKITSVAISVIQPNGSSVSFGSANPNAYCYDLHKLDSKAVFSSLKTQGTYIYKIVAEDASGRTLTFSKEFTVNSKSTTAGFETVSLSDVAMPTLKTDNFVGGVKVTLSCATAGATVYYSTDGSKPTLRYSSPIELTQTTKLKFYAAKSGLTASTVCEQTVTVAKTATPAITALPTETGYSVTLSGATSGATLYYTTDGTAPTAASTRYIGSFSLSEKTVLKAIALKSGMANSDIAQCDLEPVYPNTPGIRLISQANLGIGDALQLEWDLVANAAEYHVTVISNGNYEQIITTQGTVAAFTLEEPGTYQVRVVASNAFGNSGSSNTLIACIHDNVTVNFLNDDGSAISSQSVKYGGHARVPVAPAKTGHSFTGWQGIYTYVTEDTQVVAEYIPDQYRVTFEDAAGNVLSSKYIDYGQSYGSDDIPVPPADTGYRFVGWAVKSGPGDSFECVNGDVVFQPIFVWSNEEMPLGVAIEKAERKADSTGYTLDLKVTNIADRTVSGKLICVIKTSYDQMLVTQITPVSLEALEENRELTVSIPCTGVGKTAEAYIVAHDGTDTGRTGGAYSMVAEQTVTREEASVTTYWGDWSDWQTEAVTPGDTVEAESKVQYSYRDKETTTASTAELSGWTQSGAATTYGSWSAWSGWSLTAQTASEVKGVETRQVYYYFHYCNGSGNIAPSTSYSYGKYGPHTLYSTTKLKVDRTSSTGYTISDGEAKCEKGCGSYYYGGVKTQYRYRTRTKTVTYSFWRWGEWSEYTDTPVIATDNKQVQSRTMYRYRTLITETTSGSTTDIGTELEKAGTEYAVSGQLTNVAQDYSGKVATVMVYKEKNIDPTEEQMQYMTQLTLGEGNSYSFTFLPKEPISARTGDYIISFGIANTDGLVNNVQRIEAPKPVYDVTFKSYDGTILQTQQVLEGEDATEPVLEVPEGYELRWNRTLTNITRSVEIIALLKPKSYTVIFVDWANSSIPQISPNVTYGSVITFPEDPTAEGKIFTGWSLNEGSTVSNTVVIEAQYEDILKTVEFMNPDGSVFFSTQVPYGSHAELPDTEPTAEGWVFLAWSPDTPWWNVRQDVQVQPLLIREQTAETPVILFADGSTALSVQLETSTDHADIRYTLDGSEPTEDDPVFTQLPLDLTCTTVLKAKAFHSEFNASATASVTLTGIDPQKLPTLELTGHTLGTDSVTVTAELTNLEGYRLTRISCNLYGSYDWWEEKTAEDGQQSVSFTFGQLHEDSYHYQIIAEFETAGKVISECGSFSLEPAADHDHSYTHAVTATATCIGTGVVTYSCELCENSYEKSTPPLGHSYSDGVCSLCGKTEDPNVPAGEYYLYGRVNGEAMGMTDEDPLGSYRFVEGTLTAKFAGDSYVAIRTPQGGRYLTADPEAICATFSQTGEGELMTVPGDCQVTFTLTENPDGTLTLSYSVAAQAPVTPVIQLKYPSLSYEDEILMNVYFAASNLEDVMDMGLITYSGEVSQWNVDTAETVVPGYTFNESSGLYNVTTEGIPAKCLGDEIYFAVYAQLTDGSYVYSRLVSYSPATYAYTQLSSSNSKLAALAAAMLNYGAAAQTFFDYHTDRLVNDAMTPEQAALAEAYRLDMMETLSAVPTQKEGSFCNSGGYVRRYPTVSFESAFSINYYCIPNAAPWETVTMYYWTREDYEAAQVLTAENATGAIIMEGQETGTYQAAVAGIPAKSLDDGVYVSFCYSDGVNNYASGVLAYSIGGYCTTSAAGSTDLAPLAKATAVYGYYAKQFFS